MSCLGGYVTKEQCDKFLTLSNDHCFPPMPAIDFSGSIVINTIPKEVLQELELTEKMIKAIRAAMINVKIK